MVGLDRVGAPPILAPPRGVANSRHGELRSSLEEPHTWPTFRVKIAKTDDIAMVNVDNVRYLQRTKAGTVVCFDQSHSILIEDDIAAIQATARKRE
jgi:hypothetical protein